MKREFFINVFFLVLVNLLIKPFYIFGIDMTVQNRVGAEAYGIYFSLLGFSYLLQIVNDLGIQYFNNKNIAQHQQLLPKYFPNVIILKLLLSILYLSLTFGTAWYLGYNVRYMHMLSFLALNQIFISFLFYLRSNISGLQYYRLDSFLSTLDKILMIAICSVLLWASPFKENFQIEWFIYAQTFSFGMTALIAFIWLRKHLGRVRFRFNLPFLLLILKKSYPYAIAVFLMGIYTRIDSVMIERLFVTGKMEAGIYASAYRLLDACNMIGFLVAGLLLPMFARLIKEGEGLHDLVKFSVQLLFTATISIGICTYFFQVEIMEFLYEDTVSYSGELLGYLILSFIPVGMVYVFGTLLSANGSLKAMNVVYVIGAVSNVVWNYYLIPNYGAIGASLATLVTQSFVSLSLIFVAHRTFHFSITIKGVSQALGFVIGVVCTNILIKNYWTFNWLYAFILCGFISLCLSLVFKLIAPQNLLAFLAKKGNTESK